MLTTRGWWCFLMALMLLAFASVVPPHGHTSLALVGMTLLLWFLGQWALFRVRVQGLRQRLVLERELRDVRGPVDNLWARRSFEVRVRLRLADGLGLPYLLLHDRVPFGVEHSGVTRWQGPLTTTRPAEWGWHIQCGAVGTLRFEGIKVEAADLQGFFYEHIFLTVPRVYRVLPPLVDAEGHAPTTKRHNLLPPPGVHRHRRPGSGAELLDLRDYLPGDPPKMIAWKVSARRDRLITKEFESEVPVRCTLFVDTSNSVRIGAPGANALSREVEIAAAVAQATAGSRDPVGLCLFDEEKTTYLRPARTPQHLTHMLNQLADAAGLAPAQGRARADDLLPAAYTFAREVYPHLMTNEVNSFPFWLAWLRPPSPWTMRQPRRGDYLYGMLPVLLLLYGVAGVLLAVGLVLLLSRPALRGGMDWGFLIVALSLLMALLLTWFGVLPSRMLFPQRRRHYRWHKQMAALLSVRAGLAPTGLAMLLEDQEQFSLHLQRFLADHHVPFALPLYDRDGRYLFAAPGKVEVLAKALLHAVSRSHDNELFVLLADLLELRDQLGPVLRAVKVAQARHHQVLVVCPWPPGVPPPRKEERSGVLPLAHAPLRPAADVPVRLVDLLQQTTTLRFHEAFSRLRRSLARVGVPVLCAQGEDPAPLIVARIDRMRTMRSGPRL